MKLNINECHFCSRPGTIKFPIIAIKDDIIITQKELWVCDKHIMIMADLFGLKDKNGNIGPNFTLDPYNMSNKEE